MLMMLLLARNNMNWYKKAQQKEKVLYVMRGISGSGKSSLAKELGKNGVVLSTDDFLLVF